MSGVKDEDRSKDLKVRIAEKILNKNDFSLKHAFDDLVKDGLNFH